jgi:peptidoglycan-associated lipoprotein
MKRPSLVLSAVLASCGLVACHHKAAPPAAPARAVPTPPPAAPPPPPQASVPPMDEYSRIKAMDLDSINKLGLFQDVRFDYDRSEIRDDGKDWLKKAADVLRKYDFLTVSVEGHCDERGTVEYNLALGDRRSKAAYDYLVSLGVQPGRLKTISYGKESPLCKEHIEDCWARNRRAHFLVTGKQPML